MATAQCGVSLTQASRVSFQSATARSAQPAGLADAKPFRILKSDHGRGNLLSTKRSSTWSKVKVGAISARTAEEQQNVQVSKTASKSLTPEVLERAQNVASVRVTPPLAQITIPQQQGSSNVVPALIIGGSFLAAFLISKMGGKPQQQLAAAAAGSTNGQASLPSPPQKQQEQSAPAPQKSQSPLAAQIQAPDVDATMSAQRAMGRFFPVCERDVNFLKRVQETLGDLGFTKDNSIPFVNVCRDEITRDLVLRIDEIYGQSFNISGLGGLINCGKIGFQAGMAHAPTRPNIAKDGKAREKYIFFALPHVAVDANGEIGVVNRVGREGKNSACGALLAIKGEAGKWNGQGSVDDDNMEYGILRNKVLHRQSCQHCADEAAGPNLMEITKSCLDVITDDLTDLIHKVVDPEKADYAVLTGVQIHAGCKPPQEDDQEFVDYVAPGSMFAVVGGQRYNLKWQNNRLVSQLFSPATAEKKAPAKANA